MEPSREERIADAFFVLGAQYYGLATLAVWENISPVCGNLYHHAVEMFLKGCLARSYGTADLKRMYHDLNKIWIAFKACSDDSSLSAFDTVIQQLDRFEAIRYPDSIVDIGMVVGISMNVNGPRLSDQFTSHGPKYSIKTQELDQLVAVIFRRAGVSPGTYFGNLPGSLAKFLPPDLRRDG